MIFDKTDILSIEFQTQGNENYGYGSQPDVSVFLLDDRNAMKFEEDAVGYWNCKRNGISYEEYSAYQYTHKISFDSIPDYVKNLLFVVTIHVGDCLRKIHKIDVLFNVENNKIQSATFGPTPDKLSSCSLTFKVSFSL